MSITKLADKLNEAKKEGRIGLIPFLPGGYPNREQFWKEILELDENGADVIEIGMPFSDPVADGPVVEAASLKCLEDGINLRWIIEGLAEHRAKISAGVLLMGYYNPVLQYGLEQFAKDAQAAGVNGLIIADLPFEEGVEFRDLLAKYDIALIPLVGLNTEKERMALYSKGGNGFCYYVSVLGTTGGTASLPEEVKQGLAKAQEVFDIPVALGFGLKEPSQLKELDGVVDAAVFGSALIKHIDSGKSSAEFMKVWKK